MSATGFALLFAILSVWAWARNFSAPNITDFISFWAAGKLTLAGKAAAAYDVAQHRAVEFTISAFHGMLPFPYPPPFLIAVTPFALLPYMWGFAAWVVVGAAIYWLGTRRVIPAPFAFAHPSVLMNGLIGQNGFLTSAIFTTGTALLRERPFSAGALLGLLVIKPQLALLLPIAVIAGRLWGAIAGALASATALLLVSFLMFGRDAFEGFLNILPLYTELMRQDQWPWNEFISTFAFLRYFGLDQRIALGIHALVAIGAIALTWIAWSRDWREQVPILAAATLLVPPYMLTYDALLLIIPMAFWVREQPRPYVVGALWFLCVLPIAFYFNLYRGPNTIPIAAIASLALLALSARRRRSRLTADVDDSNLVRI